MAAAVPPDEAANVPYPFVHVNDDGSARELHPHERQWLETEFHWTDGARPYIKTTFDQLNGWGQLRGFIERRSLPAGLNVGPAPAEDPIRPKSPEELVEELNALLLSKGMVAEKLSDGTTRFSKPRPPDG